ncbi:hypothetical protein H5410_007507 [Solanum commersonii]|uniref:Uncharacterized protein n=1 Tax=Solanum commersonii TaxID=4109 RepID=A0A9J6ACV5_SOLCO|nr:hypothetical protein H5410_007507 [Solanum commersonii]
MDMVSINKLYKLVLLLLLATNIISVVKSSSNLANGPQLRLPDVEGKLGQSRLYLNLEGAREVPDYIISTL